MAIVLEGYARLSQWFSRAGQAADRLGGDSARMAAIAITDAAKKTIASRHMMRYLKFQVRGRQAVVISGHPASAAREWGWGLYGPKRAKYEIRPKRGKVLGVANVIGQKKQFQALVAKGFPVWKAPSGTEVAILGRRVMHPGGRGIHFMQRAIEEARPRILRLTGKHVLDTAVRLY